MSYSLILDLILAAFMLYDAFICFTKKQGISQKFANKYTKESLAKYSMCEGVMFIFSACMFTLFGLTNSGILKVDGLWIYAPLGIVLVVDIILEIVGRKQLVPAQGSNSSSNSNDDEEEDY